MPNSTAATPSRSASEEAPSNPLAKLDQFAPRHLGTCGPAADALARTVGYDSVDALVDQAVPASIRIDSLKGLPEPIGEHDMLAELKAIASKNTVNKSYIGLGYYPTITPPVIQRNILENPGWYTQYTPYQAEISQGRMEGLLNFQTMVSDLTGLEIANASLLDEGTAAAEAMGLAYSQVGRAGKKQKILISKTCFPQTIEVVSARAEPLGIDTEIVDLEQDLDLDGVFAVLLQYPDADGIAKDFSAIAAQAKENKVLTIVATDLLALTILKSPASLGADVAIGSAQRFGVPMGFGGPHAAFFSTRDAYKRKIPGRLIGVSKDRSGNPALRLALQTREQHIRRDKATSNICTAQALLANIAAAYAVYHGPTGLQQIARRIELLTNLSVTTLQDSGYNISEGKRFDTVVVELTESETANTIARAYEAGINLRSLSPNAVAFSLDETTSPEDLVALLAVFEVSTSPEALIEKAADLEPANASGLSRELDYLTHPVFNSYHTETEMLRYLKRLENRDLSLTTSMIPLGSCTMKLNAAAEMLPITWPEFSNMHPFAPADQTTGYLELIEQLEDWLSEITGFHATSLQPNAGSQGEYAGLLAIRAYHESRDDSGRDICLIPLSAHGTNPASAAMAGLKVVTVACDEQGNIDVDNLKTKAEEHSEHLAALMVTYPSTHGVFEASIRDICKTIHEHGGQVYMDGANMNAQCGLTSPGEIGADVCHLNLHKTFCIPHGGGGPGIGPICVAPHLAPFLPGHRLSDSIEGDQRIGAISAAPYGSASILPISWAYIRMMGATGITQSTKIAILNANYMAKRLESDFEIVYRGKNGLVAHEFIIDFRDWKELSGIEVEDVAKRLMDYGYHAPTMSFPVPGTMMIEPTESESQGELDRLCDALIAIKGEMLRVAAGEWPQDNNPLKNAPHTSQSVTATEWSSPYSREEAAFPASWTREYKYWPPVSRVDNVYGDRNLVCSCLPIEAYAQ
ncbi:aminomethyl-transferring glycine dehydrogenase [Pelagicoccus sp. SDUM812002]|uniref:aminomethyl-transferring glycine dehydrogenase n=1 Tax=Pelagicoccus sp. SDUM812002 TaxID=3041266 RepID=UPI00280D43FC|nr:aminomethyl-transferring glycine dehydrogenase [Pelagicoccus sp. SDUM812002]MDQ8184537.1 aminomethyl-transferring glycine dehydrogenase [Pelagicoccus sp. SDUM812002]